MVEKVLQKTPRTKNKKSKKEIEIRERNKSGNKMMSLVKQLKKPEQFEIRLSSKQIKERALNQLTKAENNRILELISKYLRKGMFSFSVEELHDLFGTKLDSQKKLSFIPRCSSRVTEKLRLKIPYEEAVDIFKNSIPTDECSDDEIKTLFKQIRNEEQLAQAKQYLESVRIAISERIETFIQFLPKKNLYITIKDYLELFSPRTMAPYIGDQISMPTDLYELEKAVET